jgi:hypothetical protein
MLSQLSMKVVQMLSNLSALKLRITSLHKHPDSVSIAALEEAIKTKKPIGDHALPQRGFGLGTPEGAEGGP